MIDEMDEDLENLEAALSNGAPPGKRRRRLSLLVIVSALILIPVHHDFVLNVRRNVPRSWLSPSSKQ